MRRTGTTIDTVTGTIEPLRQRQVGQTVVRFFRFWDRCRLAVSIAGLILLGTVAADTVAIAASDAPGGSVNTSESGLVLPSLVMPPTVAVDPMASIAHVELRLTAAPTTTAIVEVATVNGEGAQSAWEGGQYRAVRRLVVFPAGGPSAQSVAIPLIPGSASEGRSFALTTTQVENSGLAAGGGRTTVIFRRGAKNEPVAFSPPLQPKPQKGALVYALDAAHFLASGEGGEGVWRTRFSHGRTQAANDELGYYTDPKLHPGTHPFEVKDGLLTLRAERFRQPRKFGDATFSYGASVLQAAWLSQQYGYYEIEAQSSTARGSWSAFWLLPSDGSWPPELDVFEHPRNGLVGAGQTTVAQHWGTAKAHGQIGATLDLPRLLGRSVDLTDGFHTYGMDWRRDATTWYIDGTPVWTTPTRFHQPAFPILDVAVGGWAGAPDFEAGSTEMRIRALRIYR